MGNTSPSKRDDQEESRAEPRDGPNDPSLSEVEEAINSQNDSNAAGPKQNDGQLIGHNDPHS